MTDPAPLGEYRDRDSARRTEIAWQCDRPIALGRAEEREDS